MSTRAFSVPVVQVSGGIIVSSIGLLAGFQLGGVGTIDPLSITYIEGQTQDAWSTMALVAAGETPASTTHLETVTGSNATDYERTILGITALGEDPRTFGSENLVAKLQQDFYVDNQIGSNEQVNDDVFGILALASAGVPLDADIMIDALAAVLSNQNPDGGWAWNVGGDSDTNDTAMALSALAEFGMIPGDPEIDAGLAYLLSTQNEDAGFPYQGGGASDGASTAWVISALEKLGIDAGTWSVETETPYTFLHGLLTEDGSYKWIPSDESGSLFVTSYAVIAEAGASYPVNRIEATTPLVDFRIEGPESQVCEGSVAALNALDVVINAADQCDYTYNIDELSFGPYLTQINDDAAEGLDGWLYFVDYLSPPVGAADYNLEDGDEVLWYFGEWGWEPLRLSLSDDSITKSETTTATVKSFDQSTWSAVDAAIVSFNPTATTSASGTAELSHDTPGTYGVIAEKEGYIRSAGVQLTITGDQGHDIGLSVNVAAPGTGDGGDDGGDGGDGGSGGPDLGFTISETGLDFGSLEPGQTGSDTVVLENSGIDNLTITSQVTGDSLFVDNTSIDALSWASWFLPLTATETHEADVELEIPLTESLGSQTGSLIFWATQTD